MSILVGSIGALAIVAMMYPFLQVLSDNEIWQSDPKHKFIVSALGITSSYDYLVTLGMITAIVIILATFSQIIRIYVMSNYVYQTAHVMSQRLLQDFLYSAYKPAYQSSTEFIFTLNQEVQTITNSVIRPIIDIINSVITMLLIVGFMLIITPIITLISMVVLFIVYSTLFKKLKSKSNEYGDIRNINEQSKSAISAGIFSAYNEIVLREKQKFFFDIYSEKSQNVASSYIGHNFIAMIPPQLLQMIGFLAVIFVCFLITSPQNYIDELHMAQVLPTLGLIAISGQKMMPEFSRLYMGLSTIEFGIISLEKLRLKMMSSTLVFTPPKNETARVLKSENIYSLSLEDFKLATHSGDKVMLRGDFVEMKAGEMTAIIGPSGCGKSSLIEAFLELNSLFSGRRFLNDLALGADNVRELHALTGYVMRKPYIFEASLYANITLDFREPNLSEDLNQLLNATGLNGFLEEKQSSVFEYFLKEFGENISGGQRQRIGLARALYNNPQVLIIDEGVNSIDIESRSEVMKNLKKNSANMICVIITHDIGDLEYCDAVYEVKGDVIQKTK